MSERGEQRVALLRAHRVPVRRLAARNVRSAPLALREARDERKGANNAPRHLVRRRIHRAKVGATVAEEGKFEEGNPRSREERVQGLGLEGGDGGAGDEEGNSATIG